MVKVTEKRLKTAYELHQQKQQQQHDDDDDDDGDEEKESSAPQHHHPQQQQQQPSSSPVRQRPQPPPEPDADSEPGQEGEMVCIFVDNEDGDAPLSMELCQAKTQHAFLTLAIDTLHRQVSDPILYTTFAPGVWLC